MKPPSLPLKLMREEAAIRQIEAAIAALECGEFDVAITLAGAAEGMFDLRKDGAIFDGLAGAERALERMCRKEWIALLNMERDWLKHSSNTIEPISIELFDAALMIARACSKVVKWTARMEEFRHWYVSWLKERSV
ncbi:hypothetical protein [Ancylobacter sp. SL191]|uniref:hypothetical protein n=1 Tax=Ancylobacter sp. SL191 TaxID=2995166 RepID=UPI00226F32C9|nr:hypothetical protein [Ancylobacter sp. SL191]WAC29244.1 hypothetical protein OU996_09550 [Ancylobacter sp. SL191]